MSIYIRQTKESDSEELMDLNNLIWNKSNTPAFFYWESVEEYSKHCPVGKQFVAIINDKVAGYIGYKNPTGLKSNSHVLDIDIGVHPDFQRKGVGKALLNHVFSWGKKNGFVKISIRVLSTNRSAIQFYISQGFKEQEMLKDEFLIDGKFVDDILMYRML
ncbi:GNAT family N-acetyltransferase [Salicibibacter cibarius]|uniref:GNAT family N-acetyltransferase n=1 Tax=Salicibibacter cibarius TaxID=2743000 RepID=A0A7T7CD81_9BACI|nr:GNAT family N-acetyltransferase [Salicibibacter cibarius]QQK77705.1 GNAT family N-acetyltransferase [Salicibibacter cibarius]